MSAPALAAQTEAYSREIEGGCTVDDLHSLIAAGKKYSVIYADLSRSSGSDRRRACQPADCGVRQAIGAQSADGHTGGSVRGASTAGFGFGIFGQLLAPAMPDIKLPLVRHKEGCRKHLAEA
jgi:hypothetical protein